MWVSPPSPFSIAGRISSLNSEKTKALADSLEAQFRRVDDPLDSAFIQTFDDMMPHTGKRPQVNLH
jgi:hypothetical protein